MKKLLLHICCAPCGSGCVTHPLITQGDYRIGRLFFSNSNLDTREEYDRRLEYVRKLGGYYGIEVEADPYDHEAWLGAVKGFENEPERGARCVRCFRYSLARSAARAEQTGEFFATTLTVSPHKSSRVIFETGREFANFVELDFKKRDGFLTGRRFAKEQEYYFQNYCGCEFSKAGVEPEKAYGYGKVNTLFLSHRGESDDAPENTMAAYELAMERDSDGIELDIRLTADKYVVCCHDEDLKRVAGADLKVAESTRAELLACHSVPLLSEALACLKEEAAMQIELKGSPEIIPYCREIILAYPRQEKLTVSSFEKDTIKLAAEAFPYLRRVLLIDLASEFGGRFPEATEVIKLLEPLKCGVSFKADMRADKKFVDTLKSCGLPVVCWGIFTDELGGAMAALGVDALTCNHAVALRDRWRSGEQKKRAAGESKNSFAEEKKKI